MTEITLDQQLLFAQRLLAHSRRDGPSWAEATPQEYAGILAFLEAIVTTLEVLVENQMLMAFQPHGVFVETGNCSLEEIVKRYVESGDALREVQRGEASASEEESRG